MKVSVITPTYNRANVLPRAIQSVKNQTIDNIEHIVIDDGSEDHTDKVIEQYDHKQLEYIKLSDNTGANAARNRGIERASGKYVSFLDSDDQYLPHRIETMVACLEDSSEDIVGAAHSYAAIKDGELHRVRRVPSGVITLDDMIDGPQIGGLSSTIFRLDTLQAIDGFDESFKSCQDYDLYLRILRDHNLIGEREILSYHYRDGGGIQSDFDQVREGQNQLEKKHADILTDQLISRHHYSRGLWHGKLGDMKNARRQFRHAIQKYPKNPLYYYHYFMTVFGRKAYNLGISIKDLAARIVKT